MTKRGSEQESKDKRLSENRAKNARRQGEALRSLALPETTAKCFPCIKLIGDTHVEIENHKGVLELTRNVIRLRTSLGILRIAGSGLEVRNADRESFLIDGCICAVEYEKH